MAVAVDDGSTDRSPWPRWCRVVGWLLTAVLPVAVFSALAIWRLPGGFVSSDFRAPDLLAYDVVLIAAVGVLLRRRWPLGALVVVVVAVTVGALLSFELAPVVLFPFLILPAVAYRGSRAEIGIGAAVVLGQLLVMNTAEDDYWHTPVVGAVVAVALAVGLGLLGRLATARLANRRGRRSLTPPVGAAGVVGASTDDGRAASTPIAPFRPPWPDVPPTVPPSTVAGAEPAGSLGSRVVEGPVPASSVALPSSPGRVVAATRSGWAFVRRHRAAVLVAAVAVVLFQVAGWAAFHPRSDATAGVQPWGPPVGESGRLADDLLASDGHGHVFLVGRSGDGDVQLNGLSAGGELLWSVPVGRPSLLSTVLVAADPGGDVVVTFTRRDEGSSVSDLTLPQVVVVFDRTGVERWRTVVDESIGHALTSIAIGASDRVYLGVDAWEPNPGDSGEAFPAGVIALGEGGAVRWRQALLEAGRPSGRAPALALDADGDVYVVAAHRQVGALVAHRLAADGSERWMTVLPLVQHADERPIVAMDLAADQLYLSSGARTASFGWIPVPGAGDATLETRAVAVMAVGLDGELRWRHDVRGLDRSVVALTSVAGGGVLFAGTELPTLVADYADGRLEATFDRLDSTGRLVQEDRYRRPGGAVPNDAAPVPDGSVIVVGGFVQDVWDVDRGDADLERWRIQVSGPP